MLPYQPTTKRAEDAIPEGKRRLAKSKVSVTAWRRRRSGRVLIECIVAIFLLAISTLSIGATTRGALAMSDDASLVSDAQALSTTRVEDALVAPCATSVSGSDQWSRVNSVWMQSGSAHITQLHLDLTLGRSPIAFAGNASTVFGIEAGGVCP